MANVVEKIFKLILEFGDSKDRTDKMSKQLQSLNVRLRDVLKTIKEIGESDGLKKASQILGVYKLTVDGLTIITYDGAAISRNNTLAGYK